MKRWFTSLGLLQVFFSLMLVIAVMFVSNYFVYKNSISGIYEKVSQNNNLVVKSIIQSFDNSFRTVDNLIYSIHDLPPNESLAFADGGPADMSKVYTMAQNLSSLVGSLDYIEEVVVYFDDADLVVTSKGTSSFSYFFNTKYRHELYNANYWKAYSQTKNSFRVFPEDTFRITSSETNQQQRVKKLLVAVSGNKFRMSAKNVMILIDVEALMKHVNRKSMIPGASLIVLDQNRKTIFSTDASLDLVEVLNDVYFNTTKEVTLTSENFEYNIYKSDYNGFIYIDKVPYQFQNIDSVAKANHMIMWTAIVSAVILSVFLSIYLNRPVKSILRLLGGGHSRGNDFRKIYSGIVKLQMENESLKLQSEFANAEMRRAVFLHTLDEAVQSPEHQIQLRNYESDFFPEKHFVMVVLQAVPEKLERQPGLPAEEMADIFRNGLQREKMNVSLFYERNMQFIAIIGMEHPNVRAACIKHLRVWLARLEKEELSGYSLSAVVSKPYASEADNLKRAYRNAINGMMYRHVNDTSSVTDAEDFRYETGIYFPFEKMEKLSNYLLGGKLAECKEIISETMRENVKRNIHRHQLAHIAKTIFFYMIRYAGGSVKAGEELHRLERGFMRLADNASDFQAVENELLEAAKLLSGSSKPEQKKLNPAFISQYIELHYMENLYLDHIAEVVGTTPKYFSNYFKKTFGINYVEYLNKVRLSHARELLKDTHLSVAEIGEKTGYLNTSTFATTFRKYYGISPSEYRKQIESETAGRKAR